MRHAFSMDMGREQDLQTLAEAIVNCELKRKAGSCRAADCRSCATHGELERCLRELPACDHLRVKNMVQELYGLRAFQYGLDKPPLKDAVVETVKAVGVGLSYCVGGLLLCTACAAGIIWLISVLGNMGW